MIGAKSLNFWNAHKCTAHRSVKERKKETGAVKLVTNYRSSISFQNNSGCYKRSGIYF